MAYVEAKNSCPHAEEFCKTFSDEFKIPFNGAYKCLAKCGTCDNEEQNWLCGSCHQVLCGRYANSHMVAHATEAGHKIAIGLDDLSFWCYACESYLHHLTIEPVFNLYAKLHILKFGEPTPVVPDFLAHRKALEEAEASKIEITGPGLDDDDLSDEIKEKLKDPVVDKILGTIYGNALGDAFGLSTEFLTKAVVEEMYPNGAEIPFPTFLQNQHNCRWASGDWTDDTDQLICILDTILETRGKADPLVFARRLKSWISIGFPELGDTAGMGLGATVGAVTRSQNFVVDPHAAAYDVWDQGGRNGAANGAVMRTAILGVFNFDDWKTVSANTVAIAKTTHADPRCVASCLVITRIISQILNGADISTLDDRKKLVESASQIASSGTLNDIGEHKEVFDSYVENAVDLEKLLLDEHGKIGYTLKSMACGIHGLLTDAKFKDVMQAIAREAGDTDSNASVCGAVMGARLGYSNLPADWLQALPNKKWLDHKVLRFLGQMGYLTEEQVKTFEPVTAAVCDCVTCEAKDVPCRSTGCKHMQCLECWDKFMQKKLARGTPHFLAQELNCFADKCKLRVFPELHEAVLSEDTKAKRQHVLNTIPKTLKPTSIREFNYFYDEKTRLRHCDTKEKYAFVSQRHYEALGDIVMRHIQNLLVEDCKLKEVWLPDKNDEVKTNIFMSDDALSNPEKLMVIIQGSGAVRAGQWARALCINESLEIGTIIPYCKRAMAQGYGVIVLNPNNNIAWVPEIKVEPKVLDPADEEKLARNYFINTNKKVPKDPNLKPHKIPGHSSYREHGISIWDEFISKAEAKQIAIVAHSRGGSCTMDMLRYRGDQVLDRVQCIAFTDSVHHVEDDEKQEVKDFIRANAINWVTSKDPLDAPQEPNKWTERSGCTLLSAGHTKHEYTSGCAIESVFKFINDKLSND